MLKIIWKSSTNDECNIEGSVFYGTVSSLSILSLLLMGQLPQLGFQSPFSCLCNMVSNIWFCYFFLLTCFFLVQDFLRIGEWFNIILLLFADCFLRLSTLHKKPNCLSCVSGDTFNSGQRIGWRKDFFFLKILLSYENIYGYFVTILIKC